MTTTISPEVYKDVQAGGLKLDSSLMQYDPACDKTLGTLCSKVAEALRQDDRDAALDFIDDFLEKDWGIVKNCKFAKDLKGLIVGVARRIEEEGVEVNVECICFRAPELRDDPDAPCPLHGG